MFSAHYNIMCERWILRWLGDINNCVYLGPIYYQGPSHARAHKKHLHNTILLTRTW